MCSQGDQRNISSSSGGGGGSSSCGGCSGDSTASVLYKHHNGRNLSKLYNLYNGPGALISLVCVSPSFPSLFACRPGKLLHGLPLPEGLILDSQQRKVADLALAQQLGSEISRLPQHRELLAT